MKDNFIIPGIWHTVSPINYGYQECLPGHSCGPAVREYYLLHYIFSGNGYFERDGMTHSLSSGDMFVISPGQITTYYADSQNPWRYGWIGFTASEEFDFLSTPVMRQSQVLRIFQSIRDCCDREDSDAEVFALTFQLLYILSQSSTRSRPAPDYAVKTKAYLDNAYMHKVSIAQIAKSLHIDRRYLTAIFRKTYACSPQEYLSRLRLEKARGFLLSGHSVTHVAALSGFSDLSNFSRQFKAYFGYPPSALQRHR